MINDAFLVSATRKSVLLELRAADLEKIDGQDYRRIPRRIADDAPF